MLPKNGDFSKLLGTGENPNGFVAQTANGTIINGQGGDGWSRPWNTADGGWNDDPRIERTPLGEPAVVEVRAHTRGRRK